jgi:CheY-like chemotaxis protein
MKRRDDDRMTRSAIQKMQPVDPSVGAAALRGVTILIVDDDPMELELLGELLSGAGAHVIPASSVSEGIALVERRRPDLIVSDIRMPERDGYQLMKVVRTLSLLQGGCTPAIALSGLARNEDRVRALLSGYQAHLTKPIQAPHLIATIARLLGRSSS